MSRRIFSFGRACSALFVRSLAALSLLVTLAASGRSLGAQNAAPVGRITGRVIDATSGAGLADVTVRVVDASIATNSGVDGRFTLANVHAGTTSIQARRIGFAAKTVTAIQVVAGRTVEQDVSLAAATVRLEAVTVSATTERGSVNDALDRQRAATGVVNSVTAEQISRSPDGDAAQAAAYREVDAYVDEQAPLIPWSYPTGWWLVRPGLRGLGNLTTGILDFGRVSWGG